MTEITIYYSPENFPRIQARTQEKVMLVFISVIDSCMVLNNNGNQPEYIISQHNL